MEWIFAAKTFFARIHPFSLKKQWEYLLWGNSALFNPKAIFDMIKKRNSLRTMNQLQSKTLKKQIVRSLLKKLIAIPLSQHEYRQVCQYIIVNNLEYYQ